MKIITCVFLFIFLSLTIISCSSEDDAALKDGKVAANLSEADQLEAPYISSLTINNSSAATNQTAVSVKLSGADAVGITGYIISKQSTAPDLSSSDWVSITSQTQYSVSKNSTVGPSDALYSFYGWMKDTAKNISSTSTASIYYDTTAPTISSVSINSGDSSTSNTVVNLTISASDSLSGIAAYYASETSSAPSATATGWVDVTKTNSLSSTVSVTLTSPGAAGSYTKTVYLWLKDGAGNVSSSFSDSITLIVDDTTAPTNPSISINSGDTSTSNTIVGLSISASDNIGVTAFYTSETSSTPSSSASGWTSVASSTSYSATVSFTLSGASSAGNHSRTVYVWFKDAAGNVSASASDSITLVVSDTTDPSSPTININSGASSTSNTVVSLALSATDNVGITAYFASESSSTPASSDSGWNSVTSSTSYSATVSFTLSGASSAGNHSRTVYVWFKDAAGNVSASASDGITLVITTPPTSTSIAFQYKSVLKYYSCCVVLQLSAQDDVGVTAFYISGNNSTPNIDSNIPISLEPYPVQVPQINLNTWYSVKNVTTNLSQKVYTNDGQWGQITGYNLGTFNIYAWFRDAEGSVSQVSTDSITCSLSSCY
jgi:hypothetical protein